MKIAVLTGGGVAPGMNAAVRAVAQKAFSLGWEVLGVEDSYDGLLEGRLNPIDRSRLGGLVHRGGTFLGTGQNPLRCSLNGALPIDQTSEVTVTDAAGLVVLDAVVA